MDLLEAVNISCIRDDRTLFSQLEFKLSSGQLLLVEGDNGSGKTSLLRILCGIRLPDKGKVIWNTSLDDQQTKSLVHSHDGYAGDMAFLGHLDGNKLDLTVVENLSFSASLTHGNDCSIEQALKKVNLNLFDDVFVSNLSAGQRRRLSLARLILSGATLWILDEPFTALDIKGIEMAEREIEQHLNHGGMVVMTSHHSVSVDSNKIIKINLNE